jgi:hypothetical protein
VVLPAGGRGVDQNGNGSIDSSEGLFATGAQTDLVVRDGLEQTVADTMQLVRAVQGGVDVDGNGSVALDAVTFTILDNHSEALTGLFFLVLSRMFMQVFQMFPVALL